MKIIKLLILILLVGCEATFNSDLKQYIEDVSARTPLKFSLENSFSMENDEKETVYYYSFGYSSLNKTDSLTFTNNETSTISISSYANSSEDFTIVATPSGNIDAGAQFTVDITYNSDVNYNKTVNDTLVITDSRNRIYKVVLLGSSKRQPLDILFNDEVITGFDFGDKYIDSNQATFTLVNDSLTTININPITVPSGVYIDKTEAFFIPIFGKQEIKLYIEDPNTPLEDIMIIENDFSQSNYIEFPLYGGSNLNLSIIEIDSEGYFIKSVTDSYDFGTYNWSEENRKYFRLTNTSTFEIDIKALDPNSNEYSIVFQNQKLSSGESMDFQIVADSIIAESVNEHFRIIDNYTGREIAFTVSIQVVSVN